MARKETVKTPLPGDAGNDFTVDDDILNFKPNISFVSPTRQEAPPGPVTSTDELGDSAQDLQNLIDGYSDAGQLIEIAQQRIDDRVNSLGGNNIRLDPIKDAVAISAMKRFFPTKADPTTISYEDYQAALKTVSNSPAPPPTFGPLDIQNAQNNPYQTDFGLSQLPGAASSGGGINPLDLVAFQAQAVITLFGMMTKLITGLIKKVIGG